MNGLQSRGQRLPIAAELGQRLRVLGAVLLPEHSSAWAAPLQVGASMLSEDSPLARECSRLDRQSITFPAAWNQQRCSPVGSVRGSVRRDRTGGSCFPFKRRMPLPGASGGRECDELVEDAAIGRLRAGEPVGEIPPELEDRFTDLRDSLAGGPVFRA